METLKALLVEVVGIIIGVGAWLLLALVLRYFFPFHGGYIIFACMLLAGITITVFGVTRKEMRKGKKGS